MLLVLLLVDAAGGSGGGGGRLLAAAFLGRRWCHRIVIIVFLFWFVFLLFHVAPAARRKVHPRKLWSLLWSRSWTRCRVQPTEAAASARLAYVRRHRPVRTSTSSTDWADFRSCVCGRRRRDDDDAALLDSGCCSRRGAEGWRFVARLFVVSLLWSSIKSRGPIRCRLVRTSAWTASHSSCDMRS